YWRARAVDDLGNVGANSAIRGFIVDTAAGKVTLSTPASGTTTTDTTPAFTWNAVSDSVGIDSYVVEVSTSSAFTAFAFADTVDGTKTADTVSPGLAADTYYWRVRAIDDLGNAGANADSFSFRIDTSLASVALVNPAAGHETNAVSITFVWSGTNAETYTWHLSKSSTFATLSDSAVDTSVSTLTRTVSANDSYYWRVIGRNTFGSYDTTSVRSFVIDTVGGQVSLVAPADGHETTNTAISLQLSALSDSVGIDSYVFEAAKTTAFTTTVFADTIDGTLTTDTITGLYNDTYYWRARAVDDLGNIGAYSAVRGFIVDTAVAKVALAGPATGSLTSDSTPTLSWSAVADSVGVDSYVVEVSASSAFATIAFVDTVDGAQTSDTVTPGLPAATYFWRVRAVDNLANIGANSDSFTLQIDTTVAATQQKVGSIIPDSGDHQISTVSQRLPGALRVRVLDTGGSFVPYSPVRFTVAYPSGTGAYLGASAGTILTAGLSDSQGYVSETFTLGTAAGVYEVKVTSDSAPAVFAQMVAYADGVEFTATKWKMITPNKTTLTASAVSDAIQDDLPGAYVFWWDENAASDPNYSKYVTPSSIQRGRAYWVYAEGAGRLITQGTTGFDTLTYALNANWNMIGSGQYFYVDWDSAVRFKTAVSGLLTPAQAAAAGVIKNAAFWYNGNGWYWGPDPISPRFSKMHLKPAIGFALYAYESCTMYVYPNPAAPPDTATEIWAQAPRLSAAYDPATGQDWAIQILAQRGEYQDFQNYVGVKNTAEEAEAANLFEPPAPAGTFVSLAIRDEHGPAQTANFVPPITTLKSWTLNLVSDGKAPVGLTIDNIAAIPAKFSAYLIGGPDGPLDLRKNSSLELPAAISNPSQGDSLRSKSAAQLTLVIGLPEYLAAFLAAPLSKDQTFVYPNPGPDGTTGWMTFKYNLGAAGPVTIRIFDVGGRLARELTATGAPGPNTTTWDTTDRNGRRLGSGAYLYIIQSGGTKLIDKLAIVR
ncbi:T9SS type A sorting domain-containing protein, partial [bacterium]|nr:T9SS type A sorting domain-containing protein [bacterium]